MKYLNCTSCGKEKLTYNSQVRPLCLSCGHKGCGRSSGFKYTLEQRQAISIRRGGTGVVGEVTVLNRYPGLRKWCKSIKERDGACIDCGSTERLEAHHLVAKAKFPEVATELWNGITLCHKCHKAEHKIIGIK